MTNKTSKQDILRITEHLRSKADVHEMVYKVSMHLFSWAMIQNEMGEPAYAYSATPLKLISGDYEVFAEVTRSSHMTVVVRHIPTGFKRHHFALDLTEGCVRGVTFFSLGSEAPMITFGGNETDGYSWYTNVSEAVEKVAFTRMTTMAPTTQVMRWNLPF